MLFAYAKSSTYQSLHSTSCLLDFEQEKIREVGHLANPPTHQCANFHGNYWKACDPWVSDLPVSQNCWVPFLCIAICVNRGVEPGTSTPAGQPAMSPGKIHQLLARHVDFKCIRGRTGTINWETPWMIFSRPKAWWKNQGRILLMSQTVRSSKTKDRYCKMWENTSQLLSGCSNKALHVLAVHCNHRDTNPYIVMQEMNGLFACSLLFMLSEWDFHWFSSSLKVTRDWSACSEPQKNRL